MSDDNKLYRLVFTGNVLPGHSREKVISRLMQMLRLDKEKASRLLAGKHKQINKKLSLDRAEKLRLLVLKQGAECVLLPIEESFVTTQQLPMFIRSGDSSNPLDDVARSTVRAKNTQSVAQESISQLRKRSMPLSKSTKIKYLFYAAFLMIVEAIVIWNIKPVGQEYDCSKNTGIFSSAEGKAASVEVPEESAAVLSEEAKGTAEKLDNLSVRASLWFAEHGSENSPADVSWIWIQGDIGIAVREMNDSWGNAIRYFGKEDRFELRSAGPDKIFYTDDDIFREIVL